MSIIVPYVNGIMRSNGAYVLQNNEVEIVSSHNHWASEYIEDDEWFSSRKSRLTDEEKTLFEKWENSESRRSRDIYTDFLLLVLRLDTIHTTLGNYITTTSLYPFVKYYNYALMGFKTYYRYPLNYNPNTDKFEQYVDPVDPYLAKLNQEYEREIENFRNRIEKNELSSQDLQLYLK